ncbi:MAG: 50S ribosomal protein L6 [Bacilli bacterium]|nr:50S ribosomal protein L6 [Bacilli bacterium]
MSRIGNKPIVIPNGASVELVENTIVVKGPKGQLSFEVPSCVNVEIKDNNVTFTRESDVKEHRSLHGTTRAIVNNMVVGVTEGFEKILEIEGTGYRAQLQGKKLVVNAGYSHPVELVIPEGLTVTVPNPTEIHVVGCDKELVGQFAAEVRIIRKPEPYKGKGIHYRGEYIRRKEGKTAK